ncbi:MAG: polyprenyl synthetase family protein [Limnohabitans sp.]|jgi:farnesyl diphosphate synthase
MPAPSFDVSDWSALHLNRVERALERWIPQSAPAGLAESMRYAVLDGGKRLRPLLVMGAREAVAMPQTESSTAQAMLEDAALRAACAVELIHAYSLVHDDMPCMDNDVLRRGKPTVHVKFGEAQALLAGDTLQALAFEILTPLHEEPSEPAMAPALQARLCQVLARASGHAGMAGGQAIDLASVGLPLTEDQLRQMHRLKTGALLHASVVMGASCGNVSDAALAALGRYGEAVGLAFQVVDDVLDVTADSATLGKTAGKDAAHDKPTYVSLMGLERSQQYARDLLAQALAALDDSRLTNTHALRALAHRVVDRSH